MAAFMNLNGARVFLGQIRNEFLTKSTAASTYLTKTGTAASALKDGNGDTISSTYLKKADFESAFSETFKSAAVSGNSVNFFTSSDTSGTAAFTFNFPEETYTASDTSLTVSDNKFSVNISSDTNNILTLTESGLMVDGSNLSGYGGFASDCSIEDFDAYLSAIFELEDYLDGIFYNGETQALSDDEVAAYIDDIWAGNLIVPNPS